MNELRIYKQIHSRYQVFDASGQLPFSIIFGLCRRSPADTEPRPLLFEIAGSVLDVPYALAHGLLTLHEQNPEDVKQWAQVDLSRLNRVAEKEAGCLSRSSPINSTVHWRDAFTVYQCQIHAGGELASILEPRKKYIIRLANKNLGIKRWAYSDEKQFVDNDAKPFDDPESTKLVNSKSTAGNATFKLVNNLSWPPKIEIKMRLWPSYPSSDPAVSHPQLNNSGALEVSVFNTSSDTITVQTRGHQHFLIPWGPFQPEPDVDDDRMRIIDATPHRPPTSSLQVVESATEKIVRRNERHDIAPLTCSNADRRPKVEDVVRLKPGTPLIRKIDIAALVDGLADG